MIENRSRIEVLHYELQKNKEALQKLKRRIPYGILTGIGISLIVPFFPIKHRRSHVIDILSYPLAAFLFMVLFFCIYAFSYRQAVAKRKAEIINIISEMDKLIECEFGNK
jgi:hypothetical protein